MLEAKEVLARLSNPEARDDGWGADCPVCLGKSALRVWWRGDGEGYGCQCLDGCRPG